MSLNTILATTPLTSTGYHLKATGTTIGNSLIWDNGTNVGIGNQGTTYTLDVSGTGRFTGALTSLQSNISSGSSSYGTWNGTTSGAGFLAIQYNGSTYGWIGQGSAIVTSGSNTDLAISYQNNLVFSQGAGAAKMTITSAGNVGIGTSSPTAIGGYGGLTLSGTDGSIIDLRLNNSDNGRVFTNSAISVGLESLSTTLPIVFKTQNGSGSTERMRITSGGFVKMSSTGGYLNVNGPYNEFVTSQNNNTILFLTNSNNTYPYGLGLYFSGTSPNDTTRYFINCDDTTNTKATIYSNGTFGSRTGTYGSIISDIKYKQDITDANSQWNDIKNLRVVNFKYKEDVELEGENALRQIGFIAQEVEMVSPNLVYEAGKKDTEETWKSVKTSIIHLKAVKALQEAMLRIETLESTIQSLQEQINILAK